jgi:hypothetical protein
MKEAVLGLLSSKKFITAIVALVVTGAAKYGFDVDAEVCAAVLGLFAVLIGAQGAADNGKEAARLHVESAAAEPAPMPSGQEPS